MYVTSLLLLAVALASSSDVSLPPIHLDEASKPSYWPKLWQNITQYVYMLDLIVINELQD